MADILSNNNRIAKNTLLLYLRMFLTMAVSLYTSRIVLNILGVEDFGIYNVVGGLVAMFSILSGSLSAAISRFITFELGRNNQKHLNLVFSSAVTIQIFLAFVICILVESIGVWFLNTEMNIPGERLVAANWVLQCSILTFMVNLISLPYNAVIIAHEHMKTFAYFSILEVSLKLAVVYCLYVFLFDKLIIYAILLLTVSVVIRFVYGFYCKNNFEECNYHFIYDKKTLKKMGGFAGWNFLGSCSGLLMTQGVNILVNMHFGVVMNAARGVANQADAAINQFVNNFTTAINPQITKSYAANNREYMLLLVLRGAKYSFFLMFFWALPFLMETDFILKLWLKEVPEYSALFLRFTILISLVAVLSNTLVTSMLATGNIKKYQIIIGGFGMLVFPLVYLMYKLNYPVWIAYVIHLLIFICQLICRLFLLKRMIGLSILRYLKEVLLKVIMVVAAALLVPIIVYHMQDSSVCRFLSISLASFISTFLAIYMIGLDKNERVVIKQRILLIITKLKK